VVVVGALAYSLCIHYSNMYMHPGHCCIELLSKILSYDTYRYDSRMHMTCVLHICMCIIKLDKTKDTYGDRI
jgi:hypothetical protein